MKLKTVGLLCIIIIGIMGVFACANSPPPGENSSTIKDSGSNFNWSVVKSPITNTCYQIATHKNEEASGYQGYGYMGMVEINCSFYKGY